MSPSIFFSITRMINTEAPVSIIGSSDGVGLTVYGIDDIFGDFKKFNDVWNGVDVVVATE